VYGSRVRPRAQHAAPLRGCGNALRREQEFIESKNDLSLRLAHKNKRKASHKANRERMKFRGR